MPVAGARPASWVPTAYLAEGIPFAMVIWVAGTMFKDLGRSDAEITIGTASIGLAWSLKPLWAPLLDMAQTKKFWVIAMEIAMAILLGAAALAVRTQDAFHAVLGILWLVAFASATQDICVDGTYITSLDGKEQAAWIGAQGMCWNVGRIFATAAVVWIAGALKSRGYDARAAWSGALLVSAATMAALGAYHAVVLPRGAVSVRPTSGAEAAARFADAVRTFFEKKAIVGMLAFVFLYRIGEGFLLVEAPLFMQSSVKAGGLGLSLAQKSMVDGTLSTLVSIAGGLLGGAFVSRFGLRRTLLVCAICLNVPHLCYVALSQAVTLDHAPSSETIYAFVCLEKLGYSFGFVANMLYMMQQVAPGKYPMTHYAFATALMNLVLVPTQMASGPLADRLGYKSFFLFVLAASIPSIVAAARAPFPNARQALTEG
ncbi:MAG TPA: MFS transporter [Polyangiaceae bacterium]|nr:MFS transporter [Polyangiaceae bacterium]